MPLTNRARFYADLLLNRALSQHTRDRFKGPEAPAPVVQSDFVVERTCFEGTSFVLPNLRASSDLFSVQ